MITKSNFSLFEFNSLGLDVKAKEFVEYSSEEELIELLSNSRPEEPFIHIGRGTNLLFDGDYNGTILHSNIKGISIVDESRTSVILKIGAGELWDDFVEYAVNNNWYGVENLSYIPGEVGAAAVQNIGAYGTEIKDLILKVDTINTKGERRSMSTYECEYSYRSSFYKGTKDVFITSVVLKLSKVPVINLSYSGLKDAVGEDTSLQNIRKTIIEIRKSKLPDHNTLKNAGSFFLNPTIGKSKLESLISLHPDIPHYKINEMVYKIPAAWLIEKAGWKGKRVGDVGVSEQHSLVLVNYGSASSQDIIKVSEEIKDSVLRMFGINILEEVLIIKS